MTSMGDRLISCPIQALALKSDGYDAADLKALIDRAMHATVKRKIMRGEQVRSGNSCLGKRALNSRIAYSKYHHLPSFLLTS